MARRREREGSGKWTGIGTWTGAGIETLIDGDVGRELELELALILELQLELEIGGGEENGEGWVGRWP